MAVKVTKDMIKPVFGEGISIKEAQSQVDAAEKSAADILWAFRAANTEKTVKGK